MYQGRLLREGDSGTKSENYQDKGPGQEAQQEKMLRGGNKYWFFRGEWGMRRPDQAHVPVLCRGVIRGEPTWGA